MATKKRKADEISKDYDDADLHLPAPVWGHVLDYMPYGEVRSALLVGKQIAMEAVKYVQVLNVMTASEMHVPAARRFANVKSIKILCFLQGPERLEDFVGFNALYDDPCTVSEDVASRAPSFLAGFSKLSYAFIGGLLLRRNGKKDMVTYFIEGDGDDVSPENHQDIICSLAKSMCGAFKTGVLSQNINLRGFIGYNLFTARPCYISEQKSKNCAFCRDIVNFFPLPTLSHTTASPETHYCLDTLEFWKIIKSRPDGHQTMKEASAKFFLDWICQNGRRYKLKQDGLPTHIQEQRTKGVEVRAYSFLEEGADELDALIAEGLDPKLMSIDDFRKYFKISSDRFKTNYRGHFCYWTRGSIERLAIRGFPVDCDSLPVIEDHLICPLRPGRDYSIMKDSDQEDNDYDESDY